MAFWIAVDLHEKFLAAELNSSNSKVLHFSFKLLPKKQWWKTTKKTPQEAGNWCSRSLMSCLNVGIPSVCLSKDSYPGVPCHSWSVDGYILQQISCIWKAFIALTASGRNYFWSVIKELRRQDALTPGGSSAIQSALLGLKEPGKKT